MNIKTINDDELIEEFLGFEWDGSWDDLIYVIMRIKEIYNEESNIMILQSYSKYVKKFDLFKYSFKEIKEDCVNFIKTYNYLKEGDFL